MIAIAALYFGREILIPFALAILLSFMLAPPVDWLRAWRVPRVLAVGAVVSAACAVLGAFALLVGSQIVSLATHLPAYQQNMQEKIRAIRASAPSDGVLDRAMGVYQSLRREVSPEQDAGAASGAAAAAERPLRVEVAPGSQPLEVIGRVLAPLLGPLGTAGLVVVFVVFILLERSDLRDRFLRLAGGLHRTTGALNEAAQRVSRYLAMQLVVNAAYGVPIGVGLHLIGVPNALLWGLLATLLRFVPYLGPFIAALFPLALAFAVDPGWSMLLWTLALIVGMELVSNNVVEPWLYGSSTGLSPVAIIIAAMFWTLLWGPVGLILATPLTVCLAIMGRYVPRLEFLEVMLGSAPVLAPPEQLYQRLLAGNVEEAIELAEAGVAGSSLGEYYDRVALPALRLAERDRQNGSSTEDRRRVAAGLEAVIGELGGAEPAAAGAAVLCIAGRWELDRAAASMLAHLLRSEGVAARRVDAASVGPDAIGSLELQGVGLVCLSYLDPEPQSYARFVCRRLKRREPRLQIIAGLWSLPPEVAADRLAAALQADAVETTLSRALRRAQRAAALPAPRMVPPPVPEREAERLEALHSSGLVASRKGGHLDRVARSLAEAFDMPIALVSLIDDSCQLWKGAAGLPPDLLAARQASREFSICGHVVAAEAPLVVEDTLRDPRFSANPFLRARGIRFYAGAPLRTAGGFVIGSLCVLDTRPRMLSAREIKLLQALADEVMAGAEKPTAPLPAPVEAVHENSRVRSLRHEADQT